MTITPRTAAPAQRYSWPRRIAARLRRSWAPPTIILAYHRVLPVRDHDLLQLVVSTAAFERQVAWLAENTRTVDANDLVAEVRNPRRVDHFDGRPRVMITFDDGYVDNLRHALPVLRRHERTAVLFAAADAIGTRRSFWWDLLARIAHATEAEPRFDSFFAEHARLRALRPIERDAQLAEMAGRAGVELIAPDADRPMDWSELREWRGAGMDVGGHTRAHPFLAALPTDALDEEILGGKLDLERGLGSPIRLFAYPYGSYDAFDERCECAVRAAGYECAFANRAGQVRWARGPFVLPRCIVRDWTIDEFIARLRRWCRS